ncbi:MAG: homoserine kinase [Candidatus Marinimicrobia bacterium]|nr:homoserine kinase [FCB group bacterium]MBL7024364.1 homoserine kinase [Candidatus Neomarinimicrobiota bacterium]
MMNSDLSIEHINRVLREYEIGQFVSLEELSPGFANRSFKLETESGPYLFRWVLEKGLEDLKLELDLLEHLRGFEFKTSYPIAKGDGSFFTELAPGYAVIYDFITGVHPALSEEAARQIGSCVGQLSNIAPPVNFSRSNTINIDTCLELAEILQSAPVKLPDIYKYFTSVSAVFNERLTADLPQGLIHADVFPDNTIFQGNALRAIIDLEEACTDTLLFDLAMAINGFCFPNNELSYSFLESFLNGYLEHRLLSPEEWEALPTYIAWTAHGMLSWHLERLSQNHMERQEARVRELMTRVVDILNREESVSQNICVIRETFK